MSRRILRPFVLTLMLVGTAASVSAQQAIFVVRHAERADTGTVAPTMATDPDLSDTGHARARSLATVLKDAGITAIFVTQYKRTRQTAEPLATALGIQPTVVQAKDLPQLPEKLKAITGNVLVVGHSNTVGETIKGLGVTEPVTVEDTEFDKLFVVVRGDKPALVRLHYR